jgi:hypothetical protein
MVALRGQQQIAVIGDALALLLAQAGLDIGGWLGLEARFQRSTAWEATLLTFPPAGPPEPTKVHEPLTHSRRLMRRRLFSI